MSTHLDSLIGTWKTEGQQYEGPLGPAAKVKAVETFEWLTGNAFVVHRFEGHVGSKPSACIEIISANGEGKSHDVHTYYDNGVTGAWTIQERSPMTWVMTGTYPIGGKEAKVRCTTILTDGGDTMTGRWEYSDDGASWQPSWDVKSTRVKGS